MTLSSRQKNVISLILLIPMLIFLFWHYGRIENVAAIVGIKQNETVELQEIKILKRPNYLAEWVDKATITDVNTCTEFFNLLNSYKLRRAIFEREPRQETCYFIGITIKDRGKISLVVEGKNHIVLRNSISNFDPSDKNSSTGSYYLYKVLNVDFDTDYLERLLEEF